MRIEIKMEIDDDEGERRYEVPEIVRDALRDVPRKVEAIINRPNALCTAPEACDVLRDVNGNTIGAIKVSDR